MDVFALGFSRNRREVYAVKNPAEALLTDGCGCTLATSDEVTESDSNRVNQPNLSHGSYQCFDQVKKN
jgi:hypothetical protein